MTEKAAKERSAAEADAQRERQERLHHTIYPSERSAPVGWLRTALASSIDRLTLTASLHDASDDSPASTLLGELRSRPVLDRGTTRLF